MAPSLYFLFHLAFVISAVAVAAGSSPSKLRFRRKNGEFKILQIADMHYVAGRSTECLNVFPEQKPYCSDLNTTAFVYRVVHAEKPDLVVFTGDNIMGWDTGLFELSVKALDLAFAPVVRMKVPWVAVLGNHDDEGHLSRKAIMEHIVRMPHALSKVNPPGIEIDGYGNYHIEVGGADNTTLIDKSVLNLYFLDSGVDNSEVTPIVSYDWIQPSQLIWFNKTSAQVQKKYMSEPEAQKEPAPSLAFFHIPLQEYNSFFDSSNITGLKQENASPAKVNSGFFAAMLKAGDVRAAFVGHDHLNEFCGRLDNIQLCYAGGFGYHAYGRAGWSRRARVVSTFLNKEEDGKWGDVKYIKTWKRLDDQHLSTIDRQVLWRKGQNPRSDTIRS